jgi:hypothetical protein
MDEKIHVIVFKTAYFEVVVSHGYFDVGFLFPPGAPADLFDSRGNVAETYHRRFDNVLIVNGPQYYYCSSPTQ